MHYQKPDIFVRERIFCMFYPRQH